MNESRPYGIASRSGSIFTSDCQTLVNTVNCAGVMGAGIALEFRRRYPRMFQDYEKLCDERKIRIGKLWLYKTPGKWILNLPTKRHWKDSSKESEISSGLSEFSRSFSSLGIVSVAFPLLGAMHGGLSPDTSRTLMERHLRDCALPIEIWNYDPTASDDLLPILEARIRLVGCPHVSREMGISQKLLSTIFEAIREETLHQISQIGQLPGIGERAMEKLYRYVMEMTEPDHEIAHQLELFKDGEHEQ